jgi:iron complex outermembrane receptor protein
LRGGGRADADAGTGGTAGTLAENPFDAAGQFLTNSDDWTRETFIAPGAPRAGWMGVRYRFKA